jgi:hypothetical protein
MSSQLKACPSCGKEVSKSAKVCPHCGKKLKMGFFLKLMISLVVVIGLVIALQPSKEEALNTINSEINTIINSQEDNIRATDIQRQNTEKEIIGKIVKWTLPVFEVKKLDETKYKIQTSGFMNGTSIVSTFVTVYPQDQKDKAYIEALKTNDRITIKGKITGTSMRSIKIEPAILIMK